MDHAVFVRLFERLVGVAHLAGGFHQRLDHGLDLVAASTVPLQRLGEMHEYGWLVALLASPLGCAFSGSVVTQDGALDNFPGRWPPEGLEREGAVPTEERRPPG